MNIDIEKLVEDIELVKASIEWENPLDHQIILENAINTIKKQDDIIKKMCVSEKVNKFLSEEGLNYTAIATMPESESNDNYIYRVMAKKKDKNEFAVWTCWNASTESLNFGHYDLNYKDAIGYLVYGIDYENMKGGD